jgi:hypothetical protein
MQLIGNDVGAGPTNSFSGPFDSVASLRCCPAADGRHVGCPLPEIVSVRLGVAKRQSFNGRPPAIAVEYFLQAVHRTMRRRSRLELACASRCEVTLERHADLFTRLIISGVVVRKR